MTRAVAWLATLAILAACDDGTPPAGTGTAERIVTLAPHLTELVFAAGAGDALVGVSAYSDYPPEAAALPVVSDAFTVDQEQLALLAPDLLLAWESGTPTHVVDELRELGYRVETITTRGLDDIAGAIERIGSLAGETEAATGVAAAFSGSIAAMREHYTGASSISVFYQVSMRPLYTINGEHYIGEILELCGGSNIFADLGELAPSVTVEAVVDRNPEVLFATDVDGDAPFADWRRWQHLDANRYGNHFIVDADLIGRASPRLVDAAAEVCGFLESARANRLKIGR